MDQRHLQNNEQDTSGSGAIFSQSWLTQKKNLYWICQLLGWGAFCCLIIINYIGTIGLTQLLLDSVTTILGMFLLSHGFRYVIWRFNWLKLYFAQLLLRVIVASFVLALFAIPIQIGSSWIYDPNTVDIPIDEFYESMFAAMSFINFITLLLEGSLFFLIWQVGYFLYHHVDQYNRNLRMEAAINEFQLNRLRSQLNPHFVFNALNSVKALVDEDPERAKDSIFQLSNILRNSMVMDRKKVITLEEELNTVKNYLALEGTRFEERLSAEYDIDPTTLSCKVPPMMLQTIVENGIKHGISKLKNGGRVHIRTFKVQENLHIEIRNTGKYDPKPITKTSVSGHGVKNTIQRLELLYDNKASFKIGNANTNEVLAELIIPIWKEEPNTQKLVPSL